MRGVCSFPKLPSFNRTICPTRNFGLSVLMGEAPHDKNTTDIFCIFDSGHQLSDHKDFCHCSCSCSAQNTQKVWTNVEVRMYNLPGDLATHHATPRRLSLPLAHCPAGHKDARKGNG